MTRRDQRRQAAVIGVDRLEGRIALSTMPHVTPPAPVAAIGTPAAAVHPSSGAPVQGVSYLSFGGTAAGRASHVLTNPDTGPVVALKGTAQTTNAGTFDVVGNLRGTGFIAQGQLSGTLRLSDSRGTVTLELTGPTATGNTAPSSGTYHYVISKGTGAFAKDVGHGTIDVTLGDHAFHLTFHVAPNNA